MAAKLGGARAVRDAAEATLAKDSAAFTMDGSFDFGFSSSPMRGWGDVNFASRRAHFTMLVDGESTEVVVDDGTVYNRAEDEDLWIMTDLGEMPSSFTHMQTLEPTSLLEQLTNFDGTVRGVGEEEFEGEKVKKFEVALENSLGESAEDEELAELMGGAPEELIEVWFGADGLPAKLIYRMKFE